MNQQGKTIDGHVKTTSPGQGVKVEASKQIGLLACDSGRESSDVFQQGRKQRAG